MTRYAHSHRTIRLTMADHDGILSAIYWAREHPEIVTDHDIRLASYAAAMTAAGEGVDIETMLAANRVRAAHWRALHPQRAS